MVPSSSSGSPTRNVGPASIISPPLLPDSVWFFSMSLVVEDPDRSASVQVFLRVVLCVVGVLMCPWGEAGSGCSSSAILVLPPPMNVFRIPWNVLCPFLSVAKSYYFSSLSS